jgi:hypothetical protein
MRPSDWLWSAIAYSALADYAQRPLDLSRQVYESARSAIIDKVASHSEHHLSQIRLALQR